MKTNDLANWLLEENLVEADKYLKESSHKDPSKKEMTDALKKIAKSYEADDFDIEAAIYWYSSDYHSGQKSNLYSALSTSDYKPGRSHSSIKDGGEIAVLLYNELVSKFGGEEINESVKEIKNMAEAIDLLNDAYNAIKSSTNYLETETDRKKFKKLISDLESICIKLNKATEQIDK